MPTTPEAHLKKLIHGADRSRSRESVIAQFASVFGVRNTRIAETFLMQNASGLALPEDQCRKNPHLNTPEVMDAYRSLAKNANTLLNQVRQRVRLDKAAKAEKARQAALARNAQQLSQTWAFLDRFDLHNEGAVKALQMQSEALMANFACPLAALNTPTRRDAFWHAVLSVNRGLDPAQQKALKMAFANARKITAAVEKLAREAEREARRERREEEARARAERQRKAAYEAALIPAWKVPELLGITKAEYGRWKTEGRIPVEGLRSFQKWGKTLEYAVHPANLTERVTPVMIEHWRALHERNVHQRRKTAAKEAVVTRKANDTLRIGAREVWEEVLAEWQAADPKGAIVLALAYWATYASRWAKHYHERAEDSVRVVRSGWGWHAREHYRHSVHGYRHLSRKSDWYGLKDEAIDALSDSGYARLAFLGSRKKPGGDDLYFLEVIVPAIPDVLFSFHVPYLTGRTYLPDPRDLPSVIHPENKAGMFRFGRAIEEDESITHPERRVREEITNWLAQARTICKVRA